MNRKFLGVTLLLLGSLILVFSWPRDTGPQRFSVRAGASAHGVARDLKAQGLVAHPWTYLIWTKLFGRHSAPRPGVYLFSPRMSAYRIFQQLRQGPPLMRITLPEGWTARQMAAHMEVKGILSSAEFLDAVQREQREGFLFPDTYFFNQGLPASQVVGRMVQRFHEKEPKDMLVRAKAMRLSYRQIVTLASLVEKEARAPEERALIAGVYYNRLKKHMRLEADPTVQYALGTWKPRLTYKDLQIASPYNTYQHAGLPPGPICNPGAAALDAAAHPQATDMLFFVATGTGTHKFTHDYHEHLQVQKKGKKR